MDTVFFNFPKETDAFINPGDYISPIEKFPRLCVSTFSKKIIDKYAALEGTKQIGTLTTANGPVPIYKCAYKGQELAIYQSLVGAPACVSCFEEIIALGAGKFVLFGSCGILDNSIPAEIIVPTAAVRDEGTSYHYVPGSDEIAQDKAMTATIRACLEACGFTCRAGKVWTTDAIYRETREVAARRKAQGCIAVEMEFSAMLAAARFRGIPFAQFLYAADCLDNEEWEPRDLQDHGLSKAGRLMTLAFEIAAAM